MIISMLFSYQQKNEIFLLFKSYLFVIPVLPAQQGFQLLDTNEIQLQQGFQLFCFQKSLPVWAFRSSSLRVNFLYCLGLNFPKKIFQKNYKRCEEVR
jgi:hypothetical protein